MTRFVPAALLAFAAAQGARRIDLIGVGLVLVTGALVVAGLRMHWRRGPWRKPCEMCAEGLDGPVVCSGFRRQLSRERAFVRLSARWLAEEPIAREETRT
ncbi:MAG: hypothetical protein HGA39_05225 [Coriobacteriia bacterium]|nr:hypothetical protein [Coriobacteriia bacterium]